jgi:hypothetical protein
METKIASFRFVLLFVFVFGKKSRSECEKRKAIWDACVAEINEDPDLKENFDAQMLAAVNLMGQYSLHKLIIPFSFCS